MPSVMRAAIDAAMPKGSLWRPKFDGGLDNLLEACADNLEVAREFLSSLANIRKPATTTLLSDLEKEFGVITDTSLSEAARRLYLGAIKYAKPGTGSEDNLQAKLQAAGFDVYVYQNSPAIDPGTFLESDFAAWLGQTTAVCGNAAAFMGRGGGELLVNGIADDENNVIPDSYKRWNFIFFVGGEASGWETFRDWDMEDTTAGSWLPGGGATVQKDRATKETPGYRSLKVTRAQSDSIEDVEPVQPDASLRLAYKFRDESGSLLPIAWENKLLDGDMEKPGVTDWTAGSSSVLTKVTGAYSGNLALKVTNTIFNGRAQQFILTVGKTYRAKGVASGDGGAGYPLLTHGGVTIWTGTISTSWQTFDYTFVASNTSLRMYTAGTATGYTVWDHLSVVELSTIADGDMEDSGTSAWTAGNSATLEKTADAREGLQALRIRYNGVSNPYAYQTGVITAGEYYRITGYARSLSGISIPHIEENGNTIWTGTSSDTWQKFDVVFLSTGTTIELWTDATTSAFRGALFDGIEVSPVLYPTAGTITGAPSETITQYGKSLDSDGAADSIDLGNDAEINRDRSVTISTNVQFKDVTTLGYVFAKRDSVVNNINLYIEGGSLKTFDGAAASVTLFTGLEVDVNYHIVYRLDQNGTTVEAIVDGVFGGAKIIGTNYVLGSGQNLYLFSKSGPANYSDCQISHFEMYTEKKDDDWILAKYNAVRGAMLSGAYAEQTIDAITESRPLDGVAWGSSGGSVPMVLYKHPDTGKWEFAWIGGAGFFSQPISATLPDGISGVRLYAKLGDQAEFPDMAECNFDNITVQSVSIPAADVPASQRSQFEKIIMQVKPLHSWAGLLINYV